MRLHTSNNNSRKSNAIATNYFTTFLQTVDVTSFLNPLTKHTLLVIG